MFSGRGFLAGQRNAVKLAYEHERASQRGDPDCRCDSGTTAAACRVAVRIRPILKRLVRDEPFCAFLMLEFCNNAVC